MDWLAGGDRRELAVERIYDAAAEAIAARGLNRLSIDEIARRTGCSRATVYRHAGGKKALRDAVLARAIGRIADSVREAVAPLSGEERMASAILLSLNAVRNDRVSAALLRSIPAGDSINNSVIGSPRLAEAAADLTGLPPSERLAAEWVVRVVLALLFWPVSSHEGEETIVRELVIPALAASR
jgi:AcrR family transcriptional regulator